MANRSERFWDRVSRRSRKVADGLSGTALKTVEAAQRHLSDEDVVLDFGCGMGDLTVEIAAGVKSVRGIDTSPGMIEAARARAVDRRAVNLEFDRSTLFGRQDREGDFTAVTAFNVLHYLEDIEKAARRISDLLAPGGLFISATACLGERRTVLGAAARILPMLRNHAEREVP